MNAISPFSLIDKLGAGKAIGAAADFIADTARDAARDATRPDGPLGTIFSDVWDRLDANNDGRLTGSDALGHAVMAGAWTLDTVGRAMGLDMARTESPGTPPPDIAPPATGATTPAQMVLSAGPQTLADGPSLSGAPSGAMAGTTAGTLPTGAPTSANTAALAAIHATYQAMRSERY